MSFLNANFQHWSKILVLSSWSAMGMGLLWGGGIRRFLSPDFDILLWIASLILLVWTFSLVFFEKSSCDGCCSNSEHSENNAFTILVWLVPLMWIMMSPKEGLGGHAAGIRTTVLWQETFSNPLPSISHNPLTSPENTSRVNLMKLGLMRQELVGKRVAVEGFVKKLKQNNGEFRDGFVLYQMMMICCAADAFPLEAKILSGGENVQHGDWVIVTGLFDEINVGGQRIMRILPDRIESEPSPNNPYLLMRSMSSIRNMIRQADESQ